MIIRCPLATFLKLDFVSKLQNKLGTLIFTYSICIYILFYYLLLCLRFMNNITNMHKYKTHIMISRNSMYNNTLTC